jgi:hypothetical protein
VVLAEVVLVEVVTGKVLEVGIVEAVSLLLFLTRPGDEDIDSACWLF